ncbi:MAG: hypothetical protein OEM02_13000 [Desulfobulbaceae bacterium]|nr:hypothetical protein [Desulfobulbaceae bacterium]
MFDARAYRYTIYFFLTTLVCVYVFWIVKACDGLIPVWSDEFFYYTNARNFTENTTLRAAFTYTGKGSVLFQADGHGFAYSLLHGSIGKLIGSHPLNIPLTNIAFVLMSLLLIAKQKALQSSQKAAIAVVLLAYLTVPVFSFTFMQESLHLLVSVGCTLLLLRIYEKRMTRDILFFLFLIWCAAFFRNLWLFWSIGLIPLARSRKDLFLYLLLFIVCATVSFLNAKLLWDSFPSYFSSVTKLIKDGMILEAGRSLYGHFILNIQSYFVGGFSKPYPYYLTKLIIFSSVVTMGVLYLMRKEKIYFAAALIGFVNFSLLLITFDAWDWREIRSMSPLFFMSAIIVVYKKHLSITIAYLVFVISTSVYSFDIAKNFIAMRKQQAIVFRNTAPSRILFQQQLHTLLDTKSHPLVLLGYKPQDYTLDLLFLPIQTPSGKPVRYAINYFDEQLKVTEYDYVLSRTDLPLYAKSLRQVMIMNNFTLYEPTGKGM